MRQRVDRSLSFPGGISKMKQIFLLVCLHSVSTAVTHVTQSRIGGHSSAGEEGN